VLGRLSKARLGEAAGSDPHDDSGWQTRIDLLIAPHPKLTEAQAAAIALDYGMRGGKCTISVRRALLFYALRRLGLDVAANVRPANEQHIVLLNRERSTRRCPTGPRLEDEGVGLSCWKTGSCRRAPPMASSRPHAASRSHIARNPPAAR